LARWVGLEENGIGDARPAMRIIENNKRQKRMDRQEQSRTGKERTRRAPL